MEPDYKSIYKPRKVNLGDNLADIDRLFRKIIEPDSEILFSHMRTGKKIKKKKLILGKKELDKIMEMIEKTYSSTDGTKASAFYVEMGIYGRYKKMIRAYKACLLQGYQQFEELAMELETSDTSEQMKILLRSETWHRIKELAYRDPVTHPKFHGRREFIGRDIYRNLSKIVFVARKDDIPFFCEYYKNQWGIESAVLMAEKKTKKEAEILRKFADGEIKTIWSTTKTKRKLPEADMIVYYNLPNKKENAFHLQNIKPKKHVVLLSLWHELDKFYLNSLMGWRRGKKKKKDKNQAELNFFELPF